MTTAPVLASPLLLLRRELLHRGITDAAMREGRASGRLVRIRPGAYSDAAQWQRTFVEQQTIADAAALLAAARGARLVFSHMSAAAVHGLPLFRWQRSPVHVIAEGAAHSTRRVLRHRMSLDEGDILWSEDGDYGVTSLARTAFDIACSATAELAVPVVDAALRQVATASGARSLDLAAAEALRDDVRRRVDAAAGARGVRTARFVTEFADARSGSPGEGISRVYLHRLGFPPPRLQVPVPGRGGRTYEVDFGFDDGWGEFDGVAKYTDPRFLQGRTPEQALADEKEREDWIRGTTHKPLARWQDRHMPTAAALGRRLEAFGIRPPRTSEHPLRD